MITRIAGQPEKPSTLKQACAITLALATMIALGPAPVVAQQAQSQTQQQNAQGPDASTQDPLQNSPGAAWPQDATGQNSAQQSGTVPNGAQTNGTPQNQSAPPAVPSGSRDYDAYANPDQPAAVPPSGPLPQSLTLAAGTVVQIRTSDWLSSDRNVAGDSFSATLAQPLVVDGWVVARRGQTIMGRVAEAKKAGRVKGVSQLGIALDSLTLVDGQQVPIQSSLMQSSGGTSNGRDAVAVGTTTGVGAAIGGAAAGGSGAAIGAGAGLLASIAGVLVTRGRPTIIPPETLLTFRLQAPVTISTARGAMAFRAVTPADYASSNPNGRPRLLRGPGPYGYPPPYAYYGPYPYYGGYWYGPPVVGFGYYRWRR